MGRIDYQHRVKLEANAGAGFDVPHAGQQQGGQHFAVAHAVVNAGGHCFEQLIARGDFQQFDKRLDLWVELYDAWVQFGIGRRNLPQAVEHAELSRTDHPTDPGRGAHELTP